MVEANEARGVVMPGGFAVKDARNARAAVAPPTAPEAIEPQLSRPVPIEPEPIGAADRRLLRTGLTNELQPTG